MNKQLVRTLLEQDYSFEEIDNMSDEEYSKVERRREQFLDEVETLKAEYKDKATFTLLSGEDDVRVVLFDWIETTEKGGGVGAEIINKINNLADKYRIIMTLLPDPKSSYDLHSFWKRFGFEDIGDSQLWRMPTGSKYE